MEPGTALMCDEPLRRLQGKRSTPPISHQFNVLVATPERRVEPTAHDAGKFRKVDSAGGKSSVISVLRDSCLDVAAHHPATPGPTKHLQPLRILRDAAGLVLCTGATAMALRSPKATVPTRQRSHHEVLFRPSARSQRSHEPGGLELKNAPLSGSPRRAKSPTNSRARPSKCTASAQQVLSKC